MGNPSAIWASQLACVASAALLVVDGVAAGPPPLLRAGGLKRRPPPARYAAGDPLPYKVRHFQQPLDHFNAQHNGTFAQRYLVNDSFFRTARGGWPAPIFAFTGAEGGSVEGTFWSMQWPFDMCTQLGGLCVFIEMRFFGETHPFGSFPDGRGRGPWVPGAGGIGLLSIEQALEDNAGLLSYLRDTYAAWDSPVVTFGGSLSGTVAAMMRMRHPEVVDAAFASSSPILGWVGRQDQFSFRARVTETFDLLAHGCSDAVRSGFVGLSSLSKQQVAEVYRTCEPPDDQNGGTINSVAWGQLEGLAFDVYPPQFSTLVEACKRMDAAKAEPAQIFAALINTPSSSCFNLTQHRESVNSSDSKAWAYLACTEVMHPTGCNNVTDMFPPFNYSAAAYAPGCRHDFGASLVQSPKKLPTSFGLYHDSRVAKAYSRILFSYGSFDPWATMGYHHALSDTLPVIIIPNATHCDDVLGESSYDTSAMRDARLKELSILSEWIAVAAAERSVR